MKILIGTKNEEKIKDWKNALNGYQVITPIDLGLDIEVEEGTTSLKENAINKARAYAKKTGILSLSEDTGFFVDCLNGEPGVAAKRWNNELLEDVSMDNWTKHLKSKINGISALDSHFETAVAISDGADFLKVASEKIYGKIDSQRLNLLKKTKKTNFILPEEFLFAKTEKSWNEMTSSEKQSIYQHLRGFVKIVIKEYYLKTNMRITITGPRSVGKSTIAKMLSKKLNIPYFSSDIFMNIKSSHLGGLDKAIKKGKINEIIEYAIPYVEDILKKDKFIYDLAGGAVTSRKFSKTVKKFRELIKEKSLVVGFMPSTNKKESIELLFSRERKRKHFKELSNEALRLKVAEDCNRYYCPSFLNTCDYIVYTKNKSKREIIKEVAENLL